MAAVRSEILLVVRDSLPLDGLALPVFRVGLLVLDRTFGSISDSTGPEADGGGLEEVGIGDWLRDDADEPGTETSGVGAEKGGLLADM